MNKESAKPTLCCFADFLLLSIVIPTIPMYNHIKYKRNVGGDEKHGKIKGVIN